jgi:hypothetical protein
MQLACKVKIHHSLSVAESAFRAIRPAKQTPRVFETAPLLLTDTMKLKIAVGVPFGDRCGEPV